MYIEFKARIEVDLKDFKRIVREHGETERWLRDMTPDEYLGRLCGNAIEEKLEYASVEWNDPEILGEIDDSDLPISEDTGGFLPVVQLMKGGD